MTRAPSNPPDPRLADAGRCLVLDGGTGSELRRRGVRLDPIAWSGPAPLLASDTLVRIHRDFLAAGADVITTCTFAATRFVLEAAGYGRATEAVAMRAVAAAIEARDRERRSALIAGSLSCFPPAFDVRRYPAPAVERAAYRELADALAAHGADLLVVEMMEDTQHARQACEAALATGLPVWIGVSAAAGDGLTAYDFPETPFERVVDGLVDLRPAAFTVMHTPLEAIDAAIACLTARWGGPFGVYPELGDPGMDGADGSVSPHALAEAALGWRRAGSRAVGGCCGATPEHIAAITAAVQNARPRCT